MAMLKSYSGLNDLNNAWLARLGSVFLGALFCMIAESLMGHQLLITLVALVFYFLGVLFFVYSGILAIYVALEIDANARSDEDEDVIIGLSIFCILIILVLMIWVDWRWFAAIAAFGSFVGASTNTTPVWWRALFIIAVVATVIIQLWLNTALIHLMSSGDPLITNSHVETQAPLIAALGFGLATARWVSVRGPNRVAIFLIAFLVFFYCQTLAVDKWAETRSVETQNRAIASLMLANRLANSSDHGQQFLNANNLFEAKIKTALLSGWLTIMGFPPEYYKYIQGNQGTLLEVGNELLSHDNYLNFKPILNNLKNYYSSYLFTQLARLSDENTAQQIARKHFPVMAGEPLTRGAIADKIMTEVWEQTPERYRTANGIKIVINSNRGRNQLTNHLAQYQLSMPSRWRYENYEQFRNLLMQVVDNKVAEVNAQLNNINIDIDQLTVDVNGVSLMPWGKLTQNRLGLFFPPPTTIGANYNYEDYKDDIRAIFKSHEGIFLAQGLYKLFSLEKKGAPVKASIMSMVGIITSFIFLLAVQLFLIRKILLNIAELFCNYLINTKPVKESMYVFKYSFKKNTSHYIFYSAASTLLHLIAIMKSNYISYMLLISLGIFLTILGNQQFIYAITTSTLALFGLEPSFPSFIPDLSF